MGLKDIPKGMTASQVNVLVGVRDERVYRKEDGLGRDLMDDGTGIPKGVGRQVTWLLDMGYIRKSRADRQNKSYYELTVVGMIITQDL